jgi:hypothetical protein
MSAVCYGLSVTALAFSSFSHYCCYSSVCSVCMPQLSPHSALPPPPSPSSSCSCLRHVCLRR